MNRRAFIIESGAALLSPALSRAGASIHAIAPPQAARSYAEEMPDMLVSFLTGKLNRLASTWDEKRGQLRTAADMQRRNAAVRDDLLTMLGEFPQKTPLLARTTRVAEKDGYRIENVLFCSRPDFWVTGNLYVPTVGKAPFPAIVSPCGHYPLARMLPQYQSAYISLVKSGFVVLAYDPIGQGERRQYWNPDTDVTEVGGPVFEHSMAGQQLLLLGENLTAYMVWDGIRAIDYMLTRPEVDPARIGCAGHSGGGTLTKFLTVADQRIQCAAILEGGTSNAWPASSIGLGDAEQNLFPAALCGVDNVDLHLAIAPRPLLAGIEHESAGFNRAAGLIRSGYRLLGAEEKFTTVASDDPHSWTPKLRTATTDWFCKWFYGRPGPVAEQAYDTCSSQSLFCTPSGSLRYSNQGLNIFDIIAKRQASLLAPVATPASGADHAERQRGDRAQLTKLLRYQRETYPSGERHRATVPREGYKVEKVEFLSEPGIYIPAWIFVPAERDNTVPLILYFSEDGIQSDGLEFEGPESSGLEHGVLDQLVRQGHLVVAADVRGIGETRPASSSRSYPGDFGQLLDFETAMSYAAWSMDQSLLGMRVQDVVRSIDYVMEYQRPGAGGLHVIGKGAAGLWCLYAAALDERIQSLTCCDCLLSYRAIAATDRYLYGADVFVPNILLHLDLPAVAAAIAPRALTLVSPQDAMKKTVTAARAHDVYRSTRQAYETLGAGGKFRIEDRESGRNAVVQLCAAALAPEPARRAVAPRNISSEQARQTGVRGEV